MLESLEETRGSVHRRWVQCVPVWYVWFSSHLRTTISSMQHGCILRASEHGDDPDAALQMSTGQESELTEVVHSLNSYAGHMLTLFHDYRALRDTERATGRYMS
jgi:hypothetical protein